MISVYQITFDSRRYNSDKAIAVSQIVFRIKPKIKLIKTETTVTPKHVLPHGE